MYILIYLAPSTEDYSPSSPMGHESAGGGAAGASARALYDYQAG